MYVAHEKWTLAKRDGDRTPLLGSVGSRHVKLNILLTPFRKMEFLELDYRYSRGG